MQGIRDMNKRQEFLLKHKRIANIYYISHFWAHRISRIGRNKCTICKLCKKQGCIKNIIADKFRIASLFSPKCFEPKWESKYDDEPISKGELER